MALAHFYRPTALSLGLLSWSGLAAAADWHVAPEGSDDAAGTESAPLATLGSARELAGDGDRILLRRGGTYPAVELDVGSGVTVEAYGEGEAPVLTGSTALGLTDTWTEKASVLTAAVESRVLACYVDGKFVRLARYPNEGYLTIDNDDDPDTIVDAQLSERPGVEPGRWLGAQVRWRRWSWWWETRPIVGHDATDTLSLGPAGRFQDPFSDPGSGYFIDNDLDELDAPGEWFWDNGTLYLYPPTWADPDSMTVEVVTTSEAGALEFGDLPAGVTSSGTSFRNVQFQHFAGPALALNGPATVEGCLFAELESTGIAYGYDAQPFTVRESIFRDVRNTAIRGWGDAAGAAGSLIERNLFLRIGAERGYGGSGSWHAAGVILGQANQALVRLNRFVDIGYAGIILGSDGQTVERNLFVRTMKTLNDGAAIYANCNASVIRRNIILDTVGDLSTSHPWWPLGHGIWLEFLESFRDSEVVDNTLYGSNGSGLFLPNNFSCTVTGNHAVDNRVAGIDLSVDVETSQDHELAHNTLAAVAPTRRLDLPENVNEWFLPPYEEPVPVSLQYQSTGDYGVMTGTTLIAAESGAGVIRADDTEMSTLEDFTAAAAWATSADSRVVRANAILLFNDTESPAEVPVPGGSWAYPDGTATGGTVALEPFTSVVLVTTDPVASTPPYYAASGIDWRADEPTAGPLLPGGGATSTGGASPDSAGATAAGGRAGDTGGAAAGGRGSGGTTATAGGQASGGDAGDAGRGNTSSEAGASEGTGARGGSGNATAAAGDTQTTGQPGAVASAGTEATVAAGTAGDEPGAAGDESGVGAHSAKDSGGNDDGCGCKVAGAKQEGASGWAGLAALGTLALRRRKRSQRKGSLPRSNRVFPPAA